MVNFGNASHWLQALQTAWNLLQDLVLEKCPKAGGTTLKVRTESPQNQKVVRIVALVKMFDTLLPVLKYISSTPKASAALALAGTSDSSLLLLIVTHVPQRSTSTI